MSRKALTAPPGLNFKKEYKMNDLQKNWKLAKAKRKRNSLISDLTGKKEIDVLMLAYADWSNTGYRFSKCLELLGLNVVFLKGIKHKFNYPEQARVYGKLKNKTGTFPITVSIDNFENSIIRELMVKSRVIHFHATSYVLNDLDLSRKKVVVQHGGSTYRRQPGRCNSVFNKFSDATILQCPDLLNLGANNEHLIYYPVDTLLLKPNFEQAERRVVIGHFPSRPEVKGTATILKVIDKLSKDPMVKDKFIYRGTRAAKGKSGQVSWERHLERVSKCDVLIETLNLTYKKKKFGEWGNTAIEAAALGKVVLTNSLTPDIYAKEYGDCALNITNNAKELEDNLRRIILMSSRELKEEKIRTRKWVVENHSMEANAKRLWNKIYHNFFPERTPGILK